MVGAVVLGWFGQSVGCSVGRSLVAPLPILLAMTAEIDTGYFKGHIQIQHPYRGIC